MVLSRTNKGSQLLDKGMEGDENAASGLAYVTDLMIRFELIERDLLEFDPSSKLVMSMRRSTVNLYTKIYKYQVCIIQHYGSGAVTRFFKDVVRITDWEVLQQEIKAIDEEISNDQQAFCNDIVLRMRKDLKEFDAKNMTQHAVTQQAIKVRQSCRHTYGN